MCNLKQALALTVQNSGFPGLSYREAARKVAMPASSIRYARMAYNEGHMGAVLLGTITDQRVIGVLHGLPPAVAKTISRIETKLRRSLSRTRVAEIAWRYWVADFTRRYGAGSLLWSFQESCEATATFGEGVNYA